MARADVVEHQADPAQPDVPGSPADSFRRQNSRVYARNRG